jgi:hypothetical protein
MEARTFWFDWHRNCLSGDACPSVGGGVQCGDGTPVKGKNVCRYFCSGATRFPATVVFSFDGQSKGATPPLESGAWTDTLNTPGQELQTYVPPDQRSAQLVWQWNQSDRRGSRARRAADEIDVVQLRTPSGQIHSVSVEASQIPIPGLNCGDFVSYRYVGTRLFREVPAPVATVDVKLANVSVEQKLDAVALKDPSDTRTDRFGIAVEIGAGGRGIGGGGDAAWGPYGEAQVVLVFRQLQDVPSLRTNWLGIDIDFRAGAMFWEQPYCTKVISTSAVAPSCNGGTWERVPFWLVPFTLGPNFLFGGNVTLGFGLGGTVTTYHLSSDAFRVARPFLFTGQLHLGYRIARAVTVEAQARYLDGLDIRERVFDEAGVLEDVRAAGSGPAVLLGGLVRIDDLF